MNEDDWLNGTDFAAHVRFALDRLSPRRQRLLAAGFCRAVSDSFAHPDLTEALDVIERYADGLVPATAVERARQRCREIAQREYDAFAHRYGEHGDDARTVAAWVQHELAWGVANAASTPLSPEDVGVRVATATLQTYAVIQVTRKRSPEFVAAAEAQQLLMRGVVWEVVGNPFREPHFSPEWRTDTAVSLARQMYDAREFSAMPILADALQDAGCDNDDILNHCRTTGGGTGEPAGGATAGGAKHVRGCWVLDLVLGL